MWKIWYTDGTTIDGDGVPRHAPFDNVGIITERLPGGRTLMHTGGEYYRFVNGLWVARTIPGPDIKRGRLMPDADFHSLKEKGVEWLTR